MWVVSGLVVEAHRCQRAHDKGPVGESMLVCVRVIKHVPFKKAFGGCCGASVEAVYVWAFGGYLCRPICGQVGVGPFGPFEAHVAANLCRPTRPSLCRPIWRPSV